MSGLEKLKRWYGNTALLFFNTFLLFAFFNLLVVIGVSAIRKAQRLQKKSASPTVELIGPMYKYGFEKVRNAYPNLPADTVVQLLSETWKRGLIYEPYTGFTERPIDGKYVRVSANGYREVGPSPSPWPPHPDAVNIFVFGGSTTFGYGVADAETIPGQLQELLRKTSGKQINVYNFGRGYYYSTQERILFEQLLSAGYKPRLAIFIDGLNDLVRKQDQPEFTERFEAMFQSPQALKKPSALQLIPAVRAIQKLRPSPETPAIEDETVDPGDLEKIVHEALKRYERNRQSIQALADGMGIKALFIFQPNPAYKYDLSNHPFLPKASGRYQWLARGYQILAQESQAKPPPDNFLWCADLQEGFKENLYVDQVHYNPKLCRLIAEEISRKLLAMKLLD